MPYIVLAVVFALLAQLAYYGFAAAPEGLTLAACDQLARGVDFFAQDWGAASLGAVMLKPLYLAAFAINGGGEGIAYLMRIITLGLDFALALVAYRVLTCSIGSAKALWTTVVFLVFATVVSRLGDPFGLGTSCAFASLLCAWSTHLDAREDDGQATGYLRILKPLLCGAFAVSALAFSLVAGAFVAAVLIAALVYALRSQGVSLLPAAWVGCGAFLVIAVYLIIAMGYAEPGAVFASIARGLAAGVPSVFGVSLICGVVALLGAAGFVAAFFCLSLNAGEDSLERGFRIAATVLVAFACCGTLCVTALPAMQNGMRLVEGPGKELRVNAADAATYSDALEIAGKVSDAKSVCVAGGADTQWIHLLAPGKRADDAAQWMIVPAALDASGLDLEAYGQLAANEGFALYKRASAIGTITQA